MSTHRPVEHQTQSASPVGVGDRHSVFGSTRPELNGRKLPNADYSLVTSQAVAICEIRSQTNDAVDVPARSS